MNPLTKLTLTESKLFMREPLGVFFAIALPTLLLVILGSVPAFREHVPELGGARVVDLYAPIVIAMALAMFALSVLPQVLATYRERGILRRMATTPVGPTTVLAAQLVMCTLMSILTGAGVLVVGWIGFDVPLPRQFGGYILAYLLSAVASLAVGLLIAAIAPSGKGAGAIGSMVFFPMMFLAGLYFPRATMPDWLRRVGDFTPLGAGVQSLTDAASGAWPQLLHLGVLLVWAVGSAAVAARYFRWE